jgi:UDP-N-acetylglucosamine 2-epimerase (non-hydrolysing)
MGYRDFVQLLGDARLVVTDSGGIQEEAPYLGVPVLVAREATERPEALRDGAVELVGHDHDRLIHAALRLLAAPRPAPIAFDANAPFGDGDSARRILDLLTTSHHAESR